MMGILWRQFPLWFNYVNSTALGTTFTFWTQSAGDDEDAGGNKAAGVDIVDFCCFYLLMFCRFGEMRHGMHTASVGFDS